MITVLPEHCPRLAPRVRLQIDQVSGDPVLLYPEGFLLLNPTGHAIAQRCTGALSVQEIARALAAEYDAAEEDLLGDVAAYLAELHQRQLVILA